MLLSARSFYLKHQTLKAVNRIIYRHFQASGNIHTQNQTSFQPFGARPKQRATEYDGCMIAMQKKRKLEAAGFRKQKKVVNPLAHHTEGTTDEVLALEIEDLLRRAPSTDVDKSDRPQNDGEGDVTDSKDKPPSKVELDKEYEVEIVELSSTGDGLAYSPMRDQILIVPFTVPGDVVIAKPWRELGLQLKSDMIRFITQSPQRKGITPPCKYFGECSGCQLQMLPYEDQLKHKKTIVEKAFKHFSGLASEKIPEVDETMGSPLEYGYRTKLTPHFSISRGAAKAGLKEPPPMGYNRKGRPSVMDIEKCPIGTPILQEGLTLERARMRANLSKYKAGATILLRESTDRVPKMRSGENGDNEIYSVLDFDAAPITQELIEKPNGKPEYRVAFPTHVDHKTYTSNETDMTTEFIGPYKFVNRAGSFFQNNNSILRPFTSYVYDHCMPKSDFEPEKPSKPIKYLLDAYCGSGLFTITLSPLFASALGIDIDRRSVLAAEQNAALNSIPNVGFIEADAADLFADVPFPSDQSLVVIDPPRKGASKDFLMQLCRYGAKRVVYVSCNVHTQARDVGMIVEGFGEGSRYEIESLKGFDFFPQTGHVEGVCILNRVE